MTAQWVVLIILLLTLFLACMKIRIRSLYRPISIWCLSQAGSTNGNHKQQRVLNPMSPNVMVRRNGPWDCETWHHFLYILWPLVKTWRWQLSHFCGWCTPRWYGCWYFWHVCLIFSLFSLLFHADFCKFSCSAIFVPHLLIVAFLPFLSSSSFPVSLVLPTLFFLSLFEVTCAHVTAMADCNPRTVSSSQLTPLHCLCTGLLSLSAVDLHSW